MRMSAARVSLSVSVAVLVLSGVVAAVPGEYWPLFAVAGCGALVASLAGRGKCRIAGVCITVLVACLIAGDVREGVAYRNKMKKREEQRRKIEANDTSDARREKPTHHPKRTIDAPREIGN